MAADDQEIRAARLRAVFDQAPLTLGATLIIAGATAATLARPAGWRMAAAWLLLVALAAAARWMACRRFRRIQPDGWTVLRGWARIAVAGAGANGSLWGAASLALLPAPPEFRFFLAFVVGGLCAGTTAVNSAYFPAVVAYVLPATLPLIGLFVAQRSELGWISGGMVAVFAASLLQASRRAHGMFGRLVGMQIELSRQQGELRQANARLRREMQERREVEARLQHAQKMEAIGRLAGGIVHDFNNVVQTVQGAAERIEALAADPELQRLAATVDEAASRGAAVTRRLLAFARRGELRAESCDIVKVLRDAREMLASTLGPGISVVLDTPGTLPAVLADRAQLATVLVNLATNARDAMPAGGDVVFSAALAGAPPSALADGGYVLLSVTDGGTGMSAEVLARAAEPFFTTKPDGEGTGLGLAMARDFAEQSGGALDISSRVGAGTVVRLWLPVALAPVTLPSAQPAAGAGRLVLLVDDDAFVRDVLSEQLAARGYRVAVAATGEAALAIFAGGERASGLIVDFAMPGMDGTRLIREVRARVPGMPAILLTGSGEAAGELGLGVDNPENFVLLRKPVTTRRLVEALERVMG